MIKWAWYWKLLKLSFFGLLISCFTLFVGSSASAVSYWRYQEIWVNSYPSAMNSQYDITFLKWGGVLSSFLGVGRGVLALDENVLFWWTPNGFPYVYSPQFQWFFDRYFSCDYFNWTWSLTNCSSQSIDYSWDNSLNFEIFRSFFNNVNVWDYAYYFYDTYRYVGATYDYYTHYIYVCYSSSWLNKSLCFMGGRCSYDHFDSNCKWNVVNSQNYQDLKFGNIPYSSIWYAPWQAWYLGGWNIEWGSDNMGSSSITWDLIYSTCTKSRALSWYQRNWYTEKICYSSYNNNSDIFEGAWTITAFALTWTDIKSVWNATSDYLRGGSTGGSMWYSQWLKYWRNTYEVYQRNSDTYTNPFLGVPVSIFTLMGNIDIYGKPFTNESIIDYCNLLVYSSDLSTPYSWLYSIQICSQSAIDIVADNLWLHKDNWQVVEWSSWIWITNRPWMYNPPVGNWGSENGSQSWWSSVDSSWYKDWITFENWFFNSLKDNFKYPTNTWTNWILPSYIILWLGFIILFRFLMH